MNEKYHSYSIVQYSSHPERYEYVNVGVVVFNRSGGCFHRVISDFSRVKKVFEDVSVSILKDALYDFTVKICSLIEEGRLSSAEEFNSKRIGPFRLTPVMPFAGADLASSVDILYQKLVLNRVQKKRAIRASVKLSHALKDSGVYSLVEPKPQEVIIPRYGVKIKADFGYQNGKYNLIEAARFDKNEKGLSEAGRRVLEGKALQEITGYKLVVVGDFSDQSENIIDNFREDLDRVGVSLYSMDEVPLLAQHIRETAH